MNKAPCFLHPFKNYLYGCYMTDTGFSAIDRLPPPCRTYDLMGNIENTDNKSVSQVLCG